MRIEVLVGMIASGKTTYARQRARDGALIISHDDLTEMLHGEYRYEQGPRECYRRMEESIARVGLSVGRDVVIDRTHLTAESRRRWIEWARAHDLLDTFDGKGPMTPVVAVAFPVETAEVHARRRSESDARHRDHETWLRVARHHREQADAEPLSSTEGFAEILFAEEARRA